MRSVVRSFGHALLDEWLLDPAITYLNHGTLGATPRRVLEAQQALRDEIERQPAGVLYREIIGMVGAERPVRTRLRAAADAVAAFVGADGPDVAFVDNATTGVNAVLRSLDRTRTTSSCLPITPTAASSAPPAMPPAGPVPG